MPPGLSGASRRKLSMVWPGSRWRRSIHWSDSNIRIPLRRALLRMLESAPLAPPGEPRGEKRRQTGVANLSRRGLHIIGHAHIGERARAIVVKLVARRRIAVARLTHGPDHRHPAPLRRERHRYIRIGIEPRDLAGAGQMKQRGQVRVAAKCDRRLARLEAPGSRALVEHVVP